MTVPQYPPKRPQPSGEMVQLQIHIVGNGHSAVPLFLSMAPFENNLEGILK